MNRTAELLPEVLFYAFFCEGKSGILREELSLIQSRERYNKNCRCVFAAEWETKRRLINVGRS